MKTCIRCDQTKPLEDFHVDSSRPDGRRSACKECLHVFAQERATLVRRLKETAGCYFCADRRWPALDFHHLDPHTKEHSIGRGMLSAWKLVVEIQKCIVICRSCHSVLHAGLLSVPDDVNVDSQLTGITVSEWFGNPVPTRNMTRREAHQRYYEHHRDEILAGQSLNRQTPERKAYMAAYREANREKINEQIREWKQRKRRNQDGQT